MLDNIVKKALNDKVMLGVIIALYDADSLASTLIKTEKLKGVTYPSFLHDRQDWVQNFCQWAISVPALPMDLRSAARDALDLLNNRIVVYSGAFQGLINAMPEQLSPGFPELPASIQKAAEFISAEFKEIESFVGMEELEYSYTVHKASEIFKKRFVEIQNGRDPEMNKDPVAFAKKMAEGLHLSLQNSSKHTFEVASLKGEISSLKKQVEASDAKDQTIKSLEMMIKVQEEQIEALERELRIAKGEVM